MTRHYHNHRPLLFNTYAVTRILDSTPLTTYNSLESAFLP